MQEVRALHGADKSHRTEPSRTGLPGGCAHEKLVTEFKIVGAKLYLPPVVDLYNEEAVAYSTSHPPNMAMAQDMLWKSREKTPLEYESDHA